MKKFALLLVIPFLVSCGQKSSQIPPSVVTKVVIEKQNVPLNFLQEYELPQEPQTRDVRGLKTYILQLQGINRRHNLDKRSIKQFQDE